MMKAQVWKEMRSGRVDLFQLVASYQPVGSFFSKAVHLAMGGGSFFSANIRWSGMQRRAKRAFNHASELRLGLPDSHFILAQSVTLSPVGQLLSSEHESVVQKP
eukprot:6203711-Pleurochrysis_carterae.AAC.1